MHNYVWHLVLHIPSTNANHAAKDISLEPNCRVLTDSKASRPQASMPVENAKGIVSLMVPANADPSVRNTVAINGKGQCGCCVSLL